MAVGLVAVFNGVAQDRRDRTSAGKVAVADGQHTCTAQPGAPRDFIGHIVNLARGGAREPQRTGLIVDRPRNGGVNVDKQRGDDLPLARVCKPAGTEVVGRRDRRSLHTEGCRWDTQGVGEGSRSSTHRV